MGIRRKEQKGFTLVELITVIAIVSLLAIYLSVEMSDSGEDAKIGMATVFLLKNVPTAINSFKARHGGLCRDLPDGDGSDTTTNLDATQALLDRGLHPETPWGDTWFARYNVDVRQLTIGFPTDHAAEPATTAGDIGVAANEKLQTVFAFGGAALTSPVGTIAVETAALAPGATSGDIDKNYSVGCTTGENLACITYDCN